MLRRCWVSARGAHKERASGLCVRRRMLSRFVSQGGVVFPKCQFSPGTGPHTGIPPTWHSWPTPEGNQLRIGGNIFQFRGAF